MDRPTRTLLVLTQVCFGVFPILGKLALEAFTPRAVLVWRLFTAAGVMLGLALLRHGRDALPAPRDLGALLVLSTLGVMVNQLLFLEGLHRSTAVNAGLLMTVIPVATLGVAVLLGQERLTLRRQLGVLLSASGVAWLFLHQGADVGGRTRTGDLLLTANALSYSVYLVLAKPVLTRLPQLVVVAWVFAFGALIVPWFALDVAWAPPEARARHWLALGGVLLFPTLLAYLLNTIVLSRTRASTTAAYILLQPLVSAVLALVWLGERPAGEIWITAACVALGLWLVSLPGPPRTATPAAG
ncbi:MAG TPA: DMT family transporter [Planctomycetota bacterium]|nr:DMT family transporter [Planctomycetota bacterium]